jgi:hypothetical protein
LDAGDKLLMFPGSEMIRHGSAGSCALPPTGDKAETGFLREGGAAVPPKFQQQAIDLARLLGVVQREHRFGGRVFDGEHWVFAGFGLRGAGVRRQRVHVGCRPALPVTFCRSPGRAVRVRGGTIAHGRQQCGLLWRSFSVTAFCRVRGAAGGWAAGATRPGGRCSRRAGSRCRSGRGGRGALRAG